MNRDESTQAIVLNVNGRVDGTNAQEFSAALDTEIRASEKSMVLDLSELSYISSAGLRAILLAAKNLQQRKDKLVLCALREAILEIFRIAGFDRIIEVHNTKDEALVSLS